MAEITAGATQGGVKFFLVEKMRVRGLDMKHYLSQGLYMETVVEDGTKEKLALRTATAEPDSEGGYRFPGTRTFPAGYPT